MLPGSLACLNFFFYCFGVQAKPELRRATLEDLPSLRRLWIGADFNPQELEPGFTEFQLALDQTGNVIGMLALRTSSGHGWVHSEFFQDYSQSDSLRKILWRRVRSLAENLGLSRLWINESAPFWKEESFVPASGGILGSKPPAFGESKNWMVLQLRAEEPVANLVDKEFALFKATEKERTQKIFRQAKTMKTLAAVLVAFFFLVLIAGAVMLFKQGVSLPPAR